ncbi:2-hydroxy-acid oxidase [Platysternon megacephalum]|uniref:2-hydroxy-acid oxidase n=1 Tax=Platysternon megacephalum TaxID=55544 RepID=A0A4D9DK44_9SAUR|nr:2-hydroxy-acid oxidase [Platysternon megacephalum]
MGLLGRVVNALGEPIDGGPPISNVQFVSSDGTPPAAMERDRITEPMPLGVRAIDTMIPCGRGQRLGIFAGSGVGKSSLLSMIVRGTTAPISVLALVGERGREVREFVEGDLGPEGLARSVVVVATSDEPSLVRLRAAFTATRIAEYFRDLGNDVVLCMDSVTRVAMAQREVGLAAGEPPATRGYPPSVFGLMPRLLERAGMSPTGSITGLYTVLVDGDDLNDPIADNVRSILDGHIVLSRKLATQGHFPAIDVLESISRAEKAITTREQREASVAVRRLMAAKRDAKDLIDIGAQPTPKETLLRIRRIEEDLAKAELAQAAQDERDALERLHASREQYRRLVNELAGPLEPEQFTRLHAATTAAATSVMTMEGSVHAATDVVAQTRSRVLNAAMRTSGIERLVERDNEVRQAESLAADQKAAEESNAGRRARGRK